MPKSKPKRTRVEGQDQDSPDDELNGNTLQVTIRVPYGWLKRADQLAIDLAPAGKKLTRMDGFRAAIATGFEQYDKQK